MSDTIERMEAARDFPNNTCGASRHAQIVAEQLIDGRLIESEESDHVGESIAATVTALWEARSTIARLTAERDAAMADAERYRWLRPRLQMRSLVAVSGESHHALELRIGQSYFTTPTRGAKNYLSPAHFDDECNALDRAIENAIRAAMKGEQ